MSKHKFNPSTKITQNLLILQTVNHEFVKDLDALRTGEYCGNEEYYDEADELEEEIPFDIENDEKLMLKQFAEDNAKFKRNIAKLRYKYNLSPAYQPFLEDLAKFPKGCDGAVVMYDSQSLPEHLQPLAVKNPYNPNEYLAVLAITSETKPEEIRRYWKDILHFAMIYDKSLAIKTKKSTQRLKLDRDIKIYDLKKEGKTAREIANIISREEDRVIGYQDVNIIIKRIEDEARDLIKDKSVSS